MAEEDDPDHEELIAGLEEGDLKPNFYEGGFKTWECALDLAKLVCSRDEVDALGLCGRDGSDDDDGEDAHVIEVSYFFFFFVLSDTTEF
jgi:protein-histidine N-methyltransferase